MQVNKVEERLGLDGSDNQKFEVKAIHDSDRIVKVFTANLIQKLTFPSRAYSLVHGSFELGKEQDN